MAPQIALSSRTRISLQRLKKTLREQRQLRERLDREFARAVRERGREAKRRRRAVER